MEKSNTLLGRCVRAASSAPFETCSKTLSIFAPRQNAKSSKIISWIPLKFYVCRAFLVQADRAAAEECHYLSDLSVFLKPRHIIPNPFNRPPVPQSRNKTALKSRTTWR